LLPWFLLCYHSNCLDSHSVPESGVQFMQLRFCYHGYSSVVLSDGCSVQIVSILVPFKDESTHITITVGVQQLLWQLLSYHTGSCFSVTMTAHLWLQYNPSLSEMTRASFITFGHSMMLSGHLKACNLLYWMVGARLTSASSCECPRPPAWCAHFWRIRCECVMWALRFSGHFVVKPGSKLVNTSVWW